MDTPTIYQELVKATPVVIGGLLAVIGGFIGQVVTHRLAVSRENRLLYRERIETLVKALYEHSRWLNDRRDVMVFRNEDHDEPSPLYEVQMIQRLYFPELSSEVFAVMKAEQPMLKFINEQRIARMTDQAAWIKAWDPTPFADMYTEHLKALSAATAKCREILQTHLSTNKHSQGWFSSGLSKLIGMARRRK